jgi:PAS domain-containing protein
MCAPVADVGDLGQPATIASVTNRHRAQKGFDEHSPSQRPRLRVNASQGQNVVDAPAMSRARVGQLERDAIEREGDSEEGLRDRLARYRSLVLAIGQVIWTRDSSGEIVEEQRSWADYAGQTFAQCRQRGWLDSVHPFTAFMEAVRQLGPYRLVLDEPPPEQRGAL